MGDASCPIVSLTQSGVRCRASIAALYRQRESSLA